MVAAIYYHPDGYETSREHLMGRHAAGEGMLKAICQYATDDRLYCYTADENHFKHFLKKVQSFSQGKRICTWIHPSRMSQLKEPGALFMPGPVLSDLAWLRRHRETRDYSLCGVTHTTATDRAMDSIANLVSAPLQPWDALVCTSQSVKQMVQNLMHNYQDYLTDRFGAQKAISLPIALPIIPLGADFTIFDQPEVKRSEYRKQWREKLRIGADDAAVLYVGRFSFHDKAHPVPMYLALEHCHKSVGKPITLIMAGWFQNDVLKQEFITAAQVFCPNIKVIFVDGRNTAVKKTIWFAADVFTSLSDNVQETFGLTPIEAMAAGLPVVVSDWDGYKETVRDGVDGYRIPTWTAPSGIGVGLALGYASGSESYGNYVGYQSQFTSVDVQKCTEAFSRLLNDVALRKQMGENGKLRARALFDWKVVIKQWETLWAHQKETRTTAQEIGKRRTSQPANPLRDDPFSLFAHYPTNLLAPNSLIEKTFRASPDFVRAIGNLKITNFGSKLAYDPARIMRLLDSIPNGETVTVQSLCSRVPGSEGQALLFSILWLSKLGLINLSADNQVIANNVRASR